MSDVTSDTAAPVAVAVPEASADDARFMQLALTLGARGLGSTWPNPAVGAVIVKDGIVLGRGWTAPGGRPHAETQALKRVGEAARGATMYVSLEPCAHRGKTAPCADAIIKAGIVRVVSALEDPNSEVAGQGHKKMLEKGIAVEIGLGAEEARRIHAGHLRQLTDGRPHVTLKLAVSSDGKAGLAGRRPIQITGEAAQNYVFRMRAQNDAILIGIGTVLSDNPALSCRLPGMLERSPVRVILDAQLSVPLASHVIATVRETPTWVFAAPDASAMSAEILTDKSVKVFRVPADNGQLDLAGVVKALAGEGITRLMVEGGPTVAASFLEADLIDEAVLMHGKAAIGHEGIDALGTLPLTELTQSDRLTLRDTREFGEDRAEFFGRP
jgi:diaminohydroxyphosphoribosylaminopyrimidine deaminase/5-amino-6-(5-phosphoribosylamino)uracil reductase